MGTVFHGYRAPRAVLFALGAHPVRILILSSSSLSPEHQGCDSALRALGDLPREPEIVVEQAPLESTGAASAEPDLIIIRSELRSELPRFVLKLKMRWDRTPILGFFCDTGSALDGLLRTLSAGIDDYVSCPAKEIDLVPRVELLLRQREASLARARSSRPEGFSLKNLVGESECFLDAVELVPRLGSVDATLLITGETGTGKELFARAIHYAGPRKGKPFVPVNCGALPDHLVENELFGHAKGAFTDASAAAHGLVAESEGGTLFLDEVEALSQAAQAKLLRFLQDHEYRPLGSPKARRANVRIVAATNIDLKREVDAQRFREDLFYRLSILLLHVPPLRERCEDISLLAAHFARRYALQQGRKVPTLADATIRVLSDHDWPGNVRELEAIIQRSVIMGESDVLELGDLDLASFTNGHTTAPRGFHEAKSSAISSFERSYLTRALRAHAGNISEAARRAGTDRRAFQRLMRKHGIDRQPFVA